jgi:phenol 2-monooxygenase (NADPH)
MAGMGVSYRDMASPLVHASQHGIWRAGDRCPDVLLSLPSGEEKWLYSVACYGKHLILSIGGGVRPEPKYEHVATVYNIAASESRSSVNGEDTGSAPVFKAKWLAENERAVVVVRPDMYVGYVGTEPDSWEGYLEGLV